MSAVGDGREERTKSQNQDRRRIWGHSWVVGSSNVAELLQQNHWEGGPEDHLVQERDLPEPQVRDEAGPKAQVPCGPI